MKSVGSTRRATVAVNGKGNLIVGDQQVYTSYGGLVAGGGNFLRAPYASVSGGENLTQPSDRGWAAGAVEPNTIVGNFESP